MGTPLRRWVGARAVLHDSRKLSPPSGWLSKSAPASACRSTGPQRRTIWAMRSRRWASAWWAGRYWWTPAQRSPIVGTSIAKLDINSTTPTSPTSSPRSMPHWRI